MFIGKTRKKLTAWFINRPRVSGAMVFAAMFSVVLLIVAQRYQIIRNQEHREMSNILESVHRNITQCLQNSYTTATSLALTIDDTGTSSNFEKVASQIMDTNPRVDAIQLLPKGVVSHVYPFEENKTVLGLNILKIPDLRDDALKAIRTRKFFFAGPLNLRQGGVGLVGRLPVFTPTGFWGFSAVIIKLETLIEVSGIDEIDQSNYYFQFTRTNPATGKKEFYLPEKDDFSDKYHKSIGFPDSGLRLYIIERDASLVLWQLLPITVFGLTLALLFGFLITLFLEQPAELQKIVKEQAEKLAGSELKYKTIFDQAAIGIVYVDSKSGNIIEANSRFAKMLGFSTTELEGRNFQELTHEDDISQNIGFLQDLREGKIDGFEMEKRYFSRDGKVIWANLTVVRQDEPDQESVTHIAVVEDITQEKIAQEKIKESETRFKSLFEYSPVALWEEDFSEVKNYLQQFNANLSEAELTAFFEGNPELVRECISKVKIIDINNECLALHYPQTKEELLAGLTGLIDKYSLQIFIKQLIAILKGHNQLTSDSKFITYDGTIKEVSMRWTVMRGYEENLERVIISTEDITARKESERIISASRQKIENIVNTIDGIVWECDAETEHLHFISNKTKEILGYTVEEWRSDEDFWSKHIHPDDKEPAIRTFKKIATEKIEAEFEYRMISKDCEIVWIRDIVSVHHEDAGTILRGIMIDITKHKEADADLHNSLQLVNEQKKRLMNFSYIVSHNLRSHNANIQSIINLVQMSDSEDERNELISHLQTVSDSLNETMKHLGDLVNIQTNITLVTEPLQVNHYIETTKKILSELIVSKNVTIINNVPENAIVNYSPAYLESIILNLVSNGIRYSHTDRKPFIKLDWAEEHGFHVLRVTDNGQGIDLKRFGDKMFGMYKTFHGNPEARGVGLFMTRSQIEAMGGHITVDSEPGKGSTFSVFFSKHPSDTRVAQISN